MNTIDSSNSGTAIAEATGVEITDAVDAGAVETLKSLVAQHEGKSGGGHGGGLAKDEKEGDWTELDELAQGMTMMGSVPLPSLWIPESPQAAPTSPAAISQGPASAPLHGGAAGSVELPAFAEEAAKVIAGSAAEPIETLEPAPSNDGPATLGASILETLYRQAAPVAPAASPGVVDRTARIEELMQGMVDRVLVTDPLSGQNKEVRIKFQDNILPGTEARVWREDGRVRVEFHTNVAESARWLEGAVASLSLRLDERISQHAPSLVTVNSTGDSPSDGRSRQRHNPWDLINQGESEGDAPT